MFNLGNATCQIGQPTIHAKKPIKISEYLVACKLQRTGQQCPLLEVKK